MSDQARSSDASLEGAWEQAWRERYEPSTEQSHRRPRRAHASRPGRFRDLVVVTALLAAALSSIAVAQGGAGNRAADPAVSAARGEGSPVDLGARNPRSGASSAETAIVAKRGSGGLVLRPSNSAKGGRAVSATCDNDGLDAEDGCAVYVNKGRGAAASFRTQGAVPFALRDTNTGRVEFLNADMVDGVHASELVRRGERVGDADTLDGKDSSAFLGSAAKASDANSLDGKDSTAFLGATAKAADAQELDGKDSTEFLGSTEKAADASLLAGKDPFDYVSVSGFVQADGDIGTVGPYTTSKTATGRYTVDISPGTFAPTGESCSTLMPALTAFGTASTITTLEETGCRVDGGGRFKVRTFNASGGAVDAAFTFVLDARP